MRASSLFTGALGVKAHGRAMDSVADNIANVSTHGFKGTRALFGNLMSRYLVQMGRTSDVAGYSESNQVGLGVVARAQNVMTAAALEQTGLNTDLGIEGQGFFIVKASADYTSAFGTITSDQQGSRSDSPNYYTRAGQFHVDRNGYIVNQQNYVLQGVLADANGNVIMGPLQDLRIPSDALVSRKTSTVDLAMNLNAADTTVHNDAIAINPNDGTSYNYSTPATIYDQDGNAHNIMMYYQRVEPMSSRSWKVAMYEKDGNGGFTAIDGGQFRLNFDDYGNLSLINNPTADSFLSNYGLTSTQLITSTMGQSLSFSGANGTEQYLASAKLTFYSGLSGGETVTIGSQTYTLGAHSSATEAAAELVSLINSDTTAAGCFAINNGSGNITLQPTVANPLDISSSTSGIVVNAGATTTQVANAINNGVTSGGTLLLTDPLAAGQTITIGTQTYTIPAGATVEEMASSLADLINNAGYYNATVQGAGLYISAASAGKDGNVSFSSNDILGNVILSGSSLSGGLDGTDVSEIYAKVVTDSSGKQSLSLTRVGAGAGATITGLNSTFTPAGSTTPISFNQTQQAGNSLNVTDGKVPVNFSFSPGSTQQVVFNFAPEGGSVTTQQGQFYSLLLLDQDGYPAGEVESLSIDGNGNVWVGYTNDQYSLIGTVALATFNSPWDLDRYGDNLWLATPASGEAKIGLPNSDEFALGSIQSGALEKSNVDMAQEMVNMINYQRAYQFNSKAITTTDEMLKEAINMKR